jgi:hypothetical protein
MIDEVFESDGLKEAFVQEIVDREWEMFDQVNNRGGRAACQDDRATFEIMRASQAEAWPEALCQSYLNDLVRAQAERRNLMTEKYARMMETTFPDEYAALAALLPTLDDEALVLIEEIVKMNLEWREETFCRYPNLSYRSRTTFTKDDSPLQTSFETYLRCELRTYSPATVRLYHEMTVAHWEAGENLEETYLLNTVRRYGYESLEQANTMAQKGAMGV